MSLQCEQFDVRLNERLDARLSVANDRELVSHCDHCDTCRIKLHAWIRIETTVKSSALTVENPAIHSPRVRKQYFLSVASAAVVLVSLTLFAAYGPVRSQITAFASLPQSVGKPLSQSSVGDSTVHDEPMFADLDPSRWWQQLQDRDWLGQTMPTVRSVQEGVAPLGRSLRRAVTILTTGHQDQTT